MTSVGNEKDLCVIIFADPKPSKQCTEVVKIARKLVSLIARSFI